jgi:Ca-activated chloride channel homolog
MFGLKGWALAGGLLFGLTPQAGTAPASGSVEGLVRAATGAPLEGAAVTVEGRPSKARTDREGRFRIEGLPAGRAVLRATMLGYAAGREVVEVGEGRVTRVEFLLRAMPMALDELVTTGDAASAPPPVPVQLREAAAAKVRGRVLSLPRRRDFNTEEYQYFDDNGWKSSRRDPLSTFSIDVDAASYSNVRRFISQGQLPPKDAVRVEEMINYFHYDYPDPRGDDPFSVTTELTDAPWAPGHKLALIGLQGRRLTMDRLPPTNLVFLLDVSGSMNAPNKLPLVQAGFRLLVNQLRPEDRVAIVVYAGAAGLVLPSTSGADKERILDAIDRLQAGGSTAGGAGIQLAYAVAREHFLSEGNNRVILATDGDFNVGASSEGELVRMIEARRQDGVFLTVLGFGTGNLKDSRMEQLANKGNGHYAYVDDLLEAKKVFVQELGATLYTIAKDVKIQVEFNPARVASYRLVGYENRVLAAEDFNDDRKDAGEMGAGHSVTALYEIVPVGVDSDDDGRPAVDPLKYQNGDRPRIARDRPSGDWFTAKFRYKTPQGLRSRLLERVVRSENRPSTDFRFATAVAAFGMVLRDSEYKGDLTYREVLALARAARGRDDEGYRSELVRMVETAALLAGEGPVTGDR